MESGLMVARFVVCGSSCWSARACWRSSVGFAESLDVGKDLIWTKTFAEASTRVCQEVSVLDKPRRGSEGAGRLPMQPQESSLCLYLFRFDLTGITGEYWRTQQNVMGRGLDTQDLTQRGLAE